MISKEMFVQWCAICPFVAFVPQLLIIHHHSHRAQSTSKIVFHNVCWSLAVFFYFFCVLTNYIWFQLFSMFWFTMKLEVEVAYCLIFLLLLFNLNRRECGRMFKLKKKIIKKNWNWNCGWMFLLMRIDFIFDYGEKLKKT